MVAGQPDQQFFVVLVYIGTIATDGLTAKKNIAG
jgi:hypothetical protein